MPRCACVIRWALLLSTSVHLLAEPRHGPVDASSVHTGRLSQSIDPTPAAVQQHQGLLRGAAQRLRLRAMKMRPDLLAIPIVVYRHLEHDCGLLWPEIPSAGARVP